MIASALPICYTVCVPCFPVNVGETAPITCVLEHSSTAADSHKLSRCQPLQWRWRHVHTQSPVRTRSHNKANAVVNWPTALSCLDTHQPVPAIQSSGDDLFEHPQDRHRSQMAAAAVNQKTATPRSPSSSGQVACPNDSHAAITEQQQQRRRVFSPAVAAG